MKIPTRMKLGRYALRFVAAAITIALVVVVVLCSRAPDEKPEAGGDRPSEHHANPHGPPPGGMPRAGADNPSGHAMTAWGLEGRGNTPAEDLSGCWDSRLAARVDDVEPRTDCPDSDGDGFGDVWACPALSPDEADCDDSDATVTPATERYIRPGPFIMGSCSDHAGEDEKPVHVVWLDGYCLDRTELKAEEFGKHRGVDVADDQKDLPAQYVSFDDAAAFCRAHGKRLPTEAQFEKAARGGCELGKDSGSCDPEDLRPYAWGTDPPSCELANHNFSAQITQSPIVHMCYGKAVAVDRPLNVGPYGNLNLAGNAWEWAADLYHPRVYGDGRQRSDPTGPAAGSVHVLRGGGWNTWSTNMRAANRMPASIEASVVGIRCARWPGYKENPDDVVPLVTVRLSGEVHATGGLIKGKALYVTAWDVRDLDKSGGMPAPGHSPAAEVNLEPAGGRSQPFSIEVEKGRTYSLMTAFDAGTYFRTDGIYASPAASGGVGSSWPKTYSADQDLSGIQLPLRIGTDVPSPEAPPPGQRW